MIIEGVNNVDVDKISPGDTVKIKIKSDKIVKSLYKHANNIGCKLILLNYGEFFFKDYRCNQRDKIIDGLLE